MIPIRYHRRQVRIELCPHGSQRLRLRRRLPLRWPGRDVRILAALERARRTVRGNDRGATVSDAYLSPEDWARRRIDGQLEAAGWDVQSRDEVNVAGLHVPTGRFQLTVDPATGPVLGRQVRVAHGSSSVVAPDGPPRTFERSKNPDVTTRPP